MNDANTGREKEKAKNNIMDKVNMVINMLKINRMQIARFCDDVKL